MDSSGGGDEAERFDTEPSAAFAAGPLTLLVQGAEARVFTGTWLGRDVVVKERFRKSYRHPALDAHLTKERLRNELRALDRCRKAGLRVPTALFVADDRIAMERIKDAETVRAFVCRVQAAFPSEAEWGPRLGRVGRELGKGVGRMHAAGIVHGDLTTSNVLMRDDAVAGDEEQDLRLVFIDFGLSTMSQSAEDKGVDLYVLEKAFISTHPDTEKVFDEILRGYSEGHGKAAAAVLRKFEEVRLRGRKRDMTG